MTRSDAVQAIYEIINSGIISDDLEAKLTEVANHICDDDFEKCVDDDCYCEGCKFLKEE